MAFPRSIAGLCAFLALLIFPLVGLAQPELAPLPIAQELDPSRLLIFLEKGSPKERLQAITRLGQLHKSDTVPALIPFLADKGADVRLATATALGRICGWRDPVDERAVTPLIGLLADKEPKVRAAAAEALGEIRAPLAADSLDALVKDDADAVVRRTAAIALANLDDPRAYEPLIEMLKTADRMVKLQVAEALCTKDDPKVVGVLVTLLKEPDSGLRKQMLFGLIHGEFPELVQAVCSTLTDPSAEVRKEAADYLRIQHDPASVPALLAALEDADPEVATAAARAFTWSFELQHEGTDGLLNALKSKKASARAAALQALYKSPDPRVSAAVLPFINDANAEIRQAALCTLGSLADPRVLEPLIALLKSPEAKQRAAAATALGDLKRKEATAPLLPLLKDADFNVRWAVAKALRSLRDPASIDALIEVLDDTQPIIRESAVSALAACRAKKAAPILLKMLQTEKVDFVQSSLIRTFRYIRDDRCVAPIRALYPNSKSNVRASCMSTLISYPGNQAVDLVVDGLNSTDVITQMTAVSLAGRSGMKDPRLADPLLKIVQNPKTHGDTLVETIWILITLKEKRAVGPLTNLLATTKQEWLKDDIIRGLSLLGDEKVIPVLQPLTKDPNARTAVFAHAALLRLGQTKSLDSLMAVINGKDEMLSGTALLELSNCDQPRAQAALHAMLLDPQSPHRLSAAFFYRDDPKMLDPLLAMANGNNPEERKLAALALVGNEDPRAKDVQQRILQEGKDALPKEADSWLLPSLLLRAAAALAKQGDPAGMQYLIDQVKNFDETSHNIPDQAADALAKISGQDFRLDGEKWQAWWDKQKK